MADFKDGELKRKINNSQPRPGGAFLKHLLSALPGLTAQLTFWPLVTGGVALDLWTKSTVFAYLEHHDNISIIDGFLRLVMALNDGAAFGLFPGHPNWLIAVSVIALTGIIAIFLFSGTKQKSIHIALGLFAAGVCGNLWDRIFNDGLVRDFIDIVYWPGKHWPAFNIADSMLCAGVVLMMVSTFFTEMSSRKHPRQHK